MSLIGDRLKAIHVAFGRAGVPHAFGGAIALAYCTEEPRGTRDLDVNVFVEPDRAAAVLRTLPQGVAVDPRDVQAAVRDGQVRVWWDETPIDLFFHTHAFHAEAAATVRSVPFEDAMIPVIGCSALIVFKALFNRTRDWADIEAMLEAGVDDRDRALMWVRRLLGPTDDVTRRLANLCERIPPAGTQE